MSVSLLSAERLEAARAQYKCCLLCEHRCGSDRQAGQKGVCKAGVEARVFRHRIEYGEELELIPSHLFYLSGCDLRCAFCIAEQNAFDPHRGSVLTRRLFAEAVAWGQERGARNVQWVGGEPTIHIPAILEVLAQQSAWPRMIWKSDFYSTPAAFALLDGVVDVYVADFKFGNDACAKRIASIDNYMATVTRNLLTAANQADLIVRHLLLPGHFACCYQQVLDWMRRNLPSAKFSIRDGYLPRWRARHFSDLSSPLPVNAGLRARELALSHGLRVVA